MSPTWEDIQGWDPAALRDAVDDLSARRQTLVTATQDSEAAHAGIASTGETVDYMKTKLSSMTDDLDQLKSEASELMMATAEAADGVWQVRTKVIECHDYALVHGLIISSDGSVIRDPRSLLRFLPDVLDLKILALEFLIRSVLKLAAETDAFFTQRLGALSDGTFAGTGEHSPGLPNLPDENWSATEVAAWWNSLSQSERDALIEHHPDKIGNLDGVPMSARDKANRIRLPREIDIATNELEEAQAKYDAAQKEYEDFQNMHLDMRSGRPNPYLAERDACKESLDAAQRKMEDLRAVDYTLREKEIVNERLPEAEEELANLSETDPQNPKAAELRSEIEQLKNRRNELEAAAPRSLIYLDPREAGEDVRAAIAVGDVDNATDVASLTPGISTTPRGGINGLVGNADQLQQAAGDGTATIAFLGYDPPPGATDFDSNDSILDIPSKKRAEEGAALLNNMNEGIAAQRHAQGEDVNLHLVGHSYGSTTSGIAASTAREGLYDSLTLYGSPGSGVDQVSEYKVPEGRVYNSTNTSDKIPLVGTVKWFGQNPRTMPGVTQISHNDGGHSDYWNNPEFVEDVAQVVTHEDPGVDNPDNRAEAAR